MRLALQARPVASTLAHIITLIIYDRAVLAQGISFGSRSGQLRACSLLFASRMTKSGSKDPRPLFEFSGGKHVSQRALAAILDAVRTQGLPAATSRATYQRQRQQVANQRTSFGPLLQPMKLPSANGREHITIYVQHPMAFLEAGASASPAFKSFLLATFAKTGGQINLALYNDEVDAGKELAVRHGRKWEVVYWSILEFSYPALSHELSWFTLVAVRSDLRQKLEGGMSHVMKCVLKLFFGSPHDWRLGVVILDQLTFARARVLNQDERAHKGMLLCFGAGGKLLCLKCQNVFDHKMAPPASTMPMIPSSSLDKTLFIPHTDVSVRRLLNGLKDALNSCSPPVRFFDFVKFWSSHPFQAK